MGRELAAPLRRRTPSVAGTHNAVAPPGRSTKMSEGDRRGTRWFRAGVDGWATKMSEGGTGDPTRMLERWSVPVPEHRARRSPQLSRQSKPTGAVAVGRRRGAAGPRFCAAFQSSRQDQREVSAPGSQIVVVFTDFHDRLSITGPDARRRRGRAPAPPTVEQDCGQTRRTRARTARPSGQAGVSTRVWGRLCGATKM